VRDLKLADVVQELEVPPSLLTPTLDLSACSSTVQHPSPLLQASALRPAGRGVCMQREVLSLVEGRDRAGRPVLVLAARRCVPPELQVHLRNPRGIRPSSSPM
jgi:hypothetical protein